MKMYRRILIGLLVALLVAIPAAFLVRDPGYVLLQFRGTVIETSILMSILLFGGLLLGVWGLINLVRWPIRWWIGGARRRGRHHFREGLLALAEGRYTQAENALIRAGKLRSLRLPALLANFETARRQGDVARQTQLLDQLTENGEAGATADVLRVQLELAQQRPGSAIEMLTALDQHQRLPPAGLPLWIEALIQRQRAREALPLFKRLRKAKVMAAAACDGLEQRSAVQALQQASDEINLRSLWNELSAELKSQTPCIEAYARRAGQLRLTREAMQQIEAAQKTQWSSALASAYGDLPVEFAEERLRVAESWFNHHNTDRELLMSLAQLTAHTKQWGLCEEYLRRALAEGAGENAWQLLAFVYAEQGDATRARTALENMRAVARGDTPVPLSARANLIDLNQPAAVAEVRDEHGVPRLPGVR